MDSFKYTYDCICYYNLNILIQYISVSYHQTQTNYCQDVLLQSMQQLRSNLNNVQQYMINTRFELNNF